MRRLDLCSVVVHEVSSAKTQRRIALQYQASRNTVARVIRRVAEFIRIVELSERQMRAPEVSVYFDEMETFIHARANRVSIMLAVSDRRRIVAFDFAEFPAVGKLGRKGRKKYGPRPDRRPAERCNFFVRLQGLVEPTCILKTDEHRAYPKLVKAYFPHAEHFRFKAMRPRYGDYGELRQGGFDPLFTINHTAAMLRDNVKSLSRKTWCTAKKMGGLRDVLTLYAYYHNRYLIRVS